MDESALYTKISLLGSKVNPSYPVTKAVLSIVTPRTLS